MTSELEWFSCFSYLKQSNLIIIIVIIIIIIINNNNKKILQRHKRRFFTISSQSRELSVTRMLVWPRCNREEVTRNTSEDYHVQHVERHVQRGCHLSF